MLPIVEGVSDNDCVLAGDATCATTVGHRLYDNTPPRRLGPVFLDIRVAYSDVDAPPYMDFDNSFASSSFSRVHQLEEVDTAISDTDDIFFDGTDGIDPRVMFLVDLHVPDFAPTHDDLGAFDRQVKAIFTTSRAQHRFADILRRSGDSTAKYYFTMRTKDLDAFDRAKRAHFDDGSQAVTTDDSAPLGLSSCS
jgi:hypothetical protein